MYIIINNIHKLSSVTCHTERKALIPIGVRAICADQEADQTTPTPPNSGGKKITS